MSTKNSRSGRKYGGNHTTVIPAAGSLADVAVTLSEVSRVVPGFITAGLKPVHGQRRVKFTFNEGSILLSVRDNTSNQEIRVYTKDIRVTAKCLAEAAVDKGLKVSFRKGVARR